MNELATIKSRIHEIRGQRVMLDFDLAAMYGVEVKRLNEQVKRNVERFPEDFMFQLTKGEWEILRSQIVTANITENQEDNYLRSQIVTANIAESVSLRSQNETLKFEVPVLNLKKRECPQCTPESRVALLAVQAEAEASCLFRIDVLSVTNDVGAIYIAVWLFA